MFSQPSSRNARRHIPKHTVQSSGAKLEIELLNSGLSAMQVLSGSSACAHGAPKLPSSTLRALLAHHPCTLQLDGNILTMDEAGISEIYAFAIELARKAGRAIVAVMAK